MKVGDLVTWKEGKNPEDMGIITSMEPTSAWVSWNFLNGAEGRNFYYDLKVINETKTKGEIGMNQIRDWEGSCHRCFAESDVHTMSMFDCALICPSCKESEMRMPEYPNAEKAEMDAVKSGDFNFEGIGYPDKEISNDPVDW